MGTDLFAYENKYSNPTAGGTALYSGAISQSFWKTANTDTSMKNYNYSHDNLDRLKEAKFFSSAGNDRYNEALSYDRNGNITQLQRSGILNSGALAPSLDNLAYTYDGNVAITYNHIDLTVRITFSGTNRFIDFTYNAAGQRSAKK